MARMSWSRCPSHFSSNPGDVSGNDGHYVIVGLSVLAGFTPSRSLSIFLKMCGFHYCPARCLTV